MKPSAIRIEHMLEKIEARLVPPPRPCLTIITHRGRRDDEAEAQEKAAAMEKALAEHVASHPEDAGRTVKDFRWIVWEIVHRLTAAEISEAEISAAAARDEITKGEIEDESISLNGGKAPMALPRRLGPSICRRLTLVTSLARSHGDPCINVLLGICADRRGRNGNDDPASGS